VGGLHRARVHNRRKRPFPRMTELKFFRLMLVVVALLLLSLGSGWAFLHSKQSAAEEAVSTSFGDYNRYIAACGDGQDNGAWDLATRAYGTLARASAARDRYAEQADALMWIGLVGCLAVVLAFYAFRWAMTGRVRPLWVLGRAPSAAAQADNP
jgi:hypothetical protein